MIDFLNEIEILYEVHFAVRILNFGNMQNKQVV